MVAVSDINYKTIDKSIQVTKNSQQLGIIYPEEGKPVFSFKKDKEISALKPEDNIAIAIKLVELESTNTNTNMHTS